MSNMTILCNCLFLIPLIQSITVAVFLHWFKLIASCMFLFAIPKTALLIRPNSLFAGFMSLTVRLLLKFSFWSFRVIKLLFSPFTFLIGLVHLYFLRFVFHQYWSGFLYCCWVSGISRLSCISRLWRCLSYDRIPHLLIGNGLLFYRQKWQPDDLFNWMYFCIFFWNGFLVFLNMMFCTNAKVWGHLLASVSLKI